MGAMVPKMFPLLSVTHNTPTDEIHPKKKDKQSKLKTIHHNISHSHHDHINQRFKIKMNVFKQKIIKQFEKIQKRQNAKYRKFLSNLFSSLNELSQRHSTLSSDDNFHHNMYHQNKQSTDQQTKKIYMNKQKYKTKNKRHKEVDKDRKIQTYVNRKIFDNTINNIKTYNYN